METSLAVINTAELIDEKALNKAVREFKKFARKSLTALYHLGKVAKRIRDEELWTQRIDKKTGHGKYRGFYDFCQAELPLSESYIRRLILVVENNSLKEVKHWGITRLSVAAHLPKRKRKKFLTASKMVPACSEEFRRLAKEVREETPAQMISRHTERAPKKAFVSVPVGVKAAKMYARPTDPTAIGAPTKAATSMADDPWAKFQMADDVAIYVRLANDDEGEITAILEIRKGKDTGAINDAR